MLAAHLIREYPDQYHYFGEKEFTWNKIRQLNRNPLLTMDLGADGLKTGDLPESGFGLVGSAVQDGQRLIVVVNGLKTAADRAEESRKLLDWGFRSFDARMLLRSRRHRSATADGLWRRRGVGSAGRRPPGESLRRPRRGRAADRQDRLQGAAGRPRRGRASRSRRLNVWRGQTVVLETPLRDQGGSVAAGTLTQRALDAGIEWAGGLLRKTFAKN